ncbi:M48 family metallopeptidase [Scleromatobacter humisilvae]|uniref:M48 family metallopeptidase n=1 Tax=Scleromatobacter humisilvae TaxID=2897159 RepID=A0A9X1YPD5_9BURK|nr:M48 family metallopeptidase [Scleromatobacter humisilvae]MCK9688720.1 M48 family metallopeptidase [Scleromatobacter humisilvae]
MNTPPPIDAGRRRLLTTAAAGALLVLPATAALAQREGVQVGPRSNFESLVPAAQIEAEAARGYRDMLAQARAEHRLATPENVQLRRLVMISTRLRPFAGMWNERAIGWQWEVNLINSPQVNAFCMPGGKIAFYWGILSKLQLSDDEVAMVMGHEMTHALREHGRAQIGKQVATQGTIALLAGLFGWSNASRQVAGMGGQLLSLKYSRDDETEADLIGLELAARAGYQPQAAISLWRKMEAASRGAPPAFLSDHPSNPDRLRVIAANIPRVQGLYARAPKPDVRFGPPLAG